MHCRPRHCQSFFPEDKRDNLPKVPACTECNNAKSTLEHALTAIMPFGARHGDAGQALAMTEARLAKNRKLHANLSAGVAYSIRSINGGPWHFEMTVSTDLGGIERLCEYIVKGLAHHHWGLALGNEHFVRASYLDEAGRHGFDSLFEKNVRARVQMDHGDGVFAYEGVQSENDPELTMWKMSFYGAQVSGVKRRPGDRNSMVYGISAPRKWPATAMLMEMLGQ